MSDWQSIRELRLGERGRTIDIRHKRRLFQGIIFAGVEMESEVVEEQFMMGGKEVVMGPVHRLVIHTSQDTIGIDMTAEWRYSDA